MLAVLLVGCGSDTPEEGDVHGALLTEPYAVPDTELTDTDGQPFSLAADTDKRLTLVFFGYTHCPDICQTVMANVAAGLTRLDDAEREQVDVVFVTTDPARDDEQTLRTYLDRFDPAFLGLTGDLGTITDLGNTLGVAVEKGEKLPSGGYEVDPRHPGDRCRRRRPGTDRLAPGHLRRRVRRRRPPAADR